MSETCKKKITTVLLWPQKEQDTTSK